MVNTFRHVGIVVNDLGEAKDFWIKHLGFTVYATTIEPSPYIDELLAIIRGLPIPILEGEIKSNIYNIYSEEYWREREREMEREKKEKKKKRIELYEKYFKNKDIQIQIIELEQKLKQLKGQIVK